MSSSSSSCSFFVFHKRSSFFLRRPLPYTPTLRQLRPPLEEKISKLLPIGKVMVFDTKNYDLPEDSGCAVGGGGGNSKSYTSSDVDDASPTQFRDRPYVEKGCSVAGSNVDRMLFNDLCEMVPLVQILMDKKAGSSFTRRGSMVYTKTPCKELLYRKIAEPKGRNVSHSIPQKKKRDRPDKDSVKDDGRDNQDGDGLAMFSPKTLAAEKKEFARLRDQVGDLQRKLLEKEELLKSAEIAKGEMSSVHVQNKELIHEVAEKDSVIQSIQLQLSDARVKLADKQAILEKTQWEAMTAMKKAENLEEKLELIQREVSLFTCIFQDMISDDSLVCSREYDVAPYYAGDVNSVDDFGGTDQEKEMEEARLAYIAAVVMAKERQDEESMALATQARLRLQSFLF